MRIIFLLIVILFGATVNAQSIFTSGTGAPSGACTSGIITYQNETTGEYYSCVSGSWSLTARNTGNQSTVTTKLVNTFPSGMVMILISGTCPSGFTELTALNGKFILGTIAANGDVATTGGTDSIVPTGTNSAPIFTGNALATHTHVFTGNAVSATATAATPDLVTTNTASTGVSPTTTSTGTNASVSAGTPAGTNSTPVFTGTQFDNRPAFIKVIFCKKD